jgi:hypothetical protein
MIEQNHVQISQSLINPSLSSWRLKKPDRSGGGSHKNDRKIKIYGQRLKTFEVLHQGIKPQAVAVGSKATDLAHRHGGYIGVVAKGLAFVNVAEVNFDRGQTNSGDRISHRHTGVSVGSRVN